MNGTLILIIVIGLIVVLGRYAIAEGHRVERNNKFLKDFNDFDKKHKNGK